MSERVEDENLIDELVNFLIKFRDRERPTRPIQRAEPLEPEHAGRHTESNLPQEKQHVNSSSIDNAEDGIDANEDDTTTTRADDDNNNATTNNDFEGFDSRILFNTDHALLPTEDSPMNDWFSTCFENHNNMVHHEALNTASHTEYLTTKDPFPFPFWDISRPSPAAEAKKSHETATQGSNRGGLHTQGLEKLDIVDELQQKLTRLDDLVKEVQQKLEILDNLVKTVPERLDRLGEIETTLKGFCTAMSSGLEMVKAEHRNLEDIVTENTKQLGDWVERAENAFKIAAAEHE